MACSEKVWIGPNYSYRRIFVLGESWYGDYTDDLVTDDGYIRAYLADCQSDSMYSRIANACMDDKSLRARRDYWHGVMFTNFVQRVGATRDSRPTAEHYRDACGRLARLLEECTPRGVWILGLEQSRYSAPVVQRAGIAYEVSAHPTSYGLRNATLGASWKALVTKAKACAPAQ